MTCSLAASLLCLLPLLHSCGPDPREAEALDRVEEIVEAIESIQSIDESSDVDEALARCRESAALFDEVVKSIGKHEELSAHGEARARELSRRAWTKLRSLVDAMPKAEGLIDEYPKLESVGGAGR
ncbi:MAG: hypothetical protein AAFZ87_05915 [Planctomycetota bacterium]